MRRSRRVWYEMSNREGTCTVEQLYAALGQLPEDLVLKTNQLGNLAIYRNDVYLGYIELASTEHGKQHAKVVLDA